MFESNSSSPSFFEFLDGLAESILVTDAAGSIVHANPAAVQMLDLRADDPLIGRRFDALIVANDTDDDTGSRRWREARLCRPNREETAIEVATYPAPAGESALSIARLRHPSSLADQSISVETLSSRFGHQFANLLTPMMGYIELTRMDADSESELYGLMSSFMNICRRMLLHVQNLLLLRQRSSPTLHRVDLRHVLREALKIASDTGLTEEHVVEVEHLGVEEPMFVHAEGDLLELLLANLIVNAAEAMNKPGKIIVSIGKLGALAEVRITDTGCGISSEVRDRLFEPFFSTKANGKGIGLGLHVSQIIAHRHGATLRIASLQPVGTAVTVRFPLGAV